MKNLLDIVVDHSIKNRNDIFNNYAITKRGWTQKTIDEWRLGFFPESEILSLIANVNNEKLDVSDLEKKWVCKKIKYKYQSLFFNRIIFPIYDTHNKILGIAGRTLDDDIKPKYFNTVFPKSRNLFGLNLTKKYIVKTHRVYSFEGYADVVSSYQYGVKNVTCCMGTAFSEEHYILLSRYAEEIVMFFDNDDPGRKALKSFNEKKLDSYKKDTKIYRCFLDKEKDADEFLKKYSPEDFIKYTNEYINNKELQEKLKKI